MNEVTIQTPNAASVDVLIQGAGIGGLCLAIALQQRGHSVLVVERLNGLSQAGAGIWMAANPMQVFDFLGFADKVVEAGWVIETLRLEDFNGSTIQTTDMSEISKAFVFETIALHRSALHRILYQQLSSQTVLFGREVQSFVEEEDHVSLRLSDDSTYTAKVVIGADGLSSSIRTMAGLAGEKRYSGSSSYRAIARGASILPTEASHDAYEIWAKGCRVGFSRINPSDHYWYLTFDAPAGEQMSPVERQTHARSLFRSFFPQWIGLLDHTHSDEILRTDISDLKRLPRWSSGRIGLLGDAAHATTPNLGQGGAMAVEDAYVLAEVFDQEGFNQAALQKFEQRRRNKVDWTVSTSWSIGRLCHIGNPLGRRIRNALLKLTPKSVSRKQIEKLYSLT